MGTHTAAAVAVAAAVVAEKELAASGDILEALICLQAACFTYATPPETRIPTSPRHCPL